MAKNKITDFQLRTDVSSDCNFVTDDGIQTYRVTAEQIKEFVLALNSIESTMLQDLIVTTQKIAAGAVTDAKTNFTPPTVQRFKSGSGTYTTPAGVKYIVVEMVGGGGGGGGGNNNTQGTNGQNTTFGSSLLVAGGGGGNACGSVSSVTNAGGTVSISAPAVELHAMEGMRGSLGNVQAGYGPGGDGGSSFFGGRGAGGSQASGGTAAIANSGSGGGGGGINSASAANSGHGGSAGGYLKALITSPSATYSYSVGANGLGASGVGVGMAGANGAIGLIVVTEYYQ